MKSATMPDPITAEPSGDRGSTWRRLLFTAGMVAASENMAFSEIELRVDLGEVVATMENEDLFWHTFTVEVLGVDLRVPVGAELGASFDAPPGGAGSSVPSPDTSRREWREH